MTMTDAHNPVTVVNSHITNDVLAFKSIFFKKNTFLTKAKETEAGLNWNAIISKQIHCNWPVQL